MDGRLLGHIIPFSKSPSIKHYLDHDVGFLYKCKIMDKEEKPCNKSQGWEPIHQKCKAINKQKQKQTNNQQKSSKDPMQKKLMVTK